MENYTGPINYTTSNRTTKKEKQRQRLNLILEASRSASSYAEISQITGLTYEQIYRFLTKYPAERKEVKESIRRNAEGAKIQFIVEASMKSLSYKDMSAKLGMTYGQIVYQLSKNPCIRQEVDKNIELAKERCIQQAIDILKERSTSESISKINRLSMKQLGQLVYVNEDPLSISEGKSEQNLEYLIFRLIEASKKACSNKQLAELGEISLGQLEIVLGITDPIQRQIIKDNIMHNSESIKVKDLLEMSKTSSSITDLANKMFISEANVMRLLWKYPGIRKTVNRNIRKFNEAPKIRQIMEASKMPRMKTLKGVAAYIGMNYQQMLKLLDKYSSERQIIKHNLRSNRFSKADDEE